MTRPLTTFAVVAFSLHFLHLCLHLFAFLVFTLFSLFCVHSTYLVGTFFFVLNIMIVGRAFVFCTYIDDTQRSLDRVQY